jgi:uncharacterized membrane-anchored protein
MNKSVSADSTRRVGWLVGLLACAWMMANVAPARAQEDSDSLFDAVNWQEGPCTGKLGDQAKIDLPAGYLFASAQDTRMLLEAMENPTDGSEQGSVFPEEGDWFVVFEFADVGYIKDDEKDDLDADEILESLKDGNEEANKERKRRGWAPIEITGWASKPHYDPATHNLEWATLAVSDGMEGVNYNTRLLGRRGYMSVALVCDPEELDSALPVFKDLLKGFSFTSGNKYAEFRKGDKIAEYGLAALITGGAAAVAIKSGLLQKLWKLIVVAVVGIGAAIRKVFRRSSTA